VKITNLKVSGEAVQKKYFQAIWVEAVYGGSRGIYGF
jgi:hypothetical protein